MLSKIKKFSFILIVFCFLTFSRVQTYAQEDTKDYFTVNADLTYQVEDDATTNVKQKISILNKKEFVYSPSYSITLHIKNIRDINVSGPEGKIPYTVKDEGQDTKVIDINFPDRVVGVGKGNSFTFSYSTSDFARRSGGVFVVNIPSLASAQNFDSYVVHVDVPNNIGEATIIKPNVSYTKSGNSYVFTKNSLANGGIEMFFGEGQVYQFDLVYHLENKNLYPVSTEIALPPDTSYQQVLITKIDPKPENTYQDQDGNSLAQYSLPPKSKRTVRATVLVKVSANPQKEPLTPSQEKIYLRPQKYWEVTDPEIQKLALQYKTPEEIYNYVVKTLSYSDKKTSSNNTRLGAKKVLSQPYYAVCLEFTDLFIAIARAAGIPARAVEGYAYTQDSEDKPVSLFQDVLHAWPEYYDQKKGSWVMVDPTWADTTGGIDYFNELDYDHVAFTINGAKSTYPVPAGGYKLEGENSQDIDVNFPDSAVFQKVTNSKINTSFPAITHGSTINGTVTLENNGNYKIPSYRVKIYLDGTYMSTVSLPDTPPFGKSTIDVSVPVKISQEFADSLTKITHKVTIQDENGKIISTSVVRVFPLSIFIFLGGAILIAIGIVLIIAIKARSLPVQRQK